MSYLIYLYTQNKILNVIFIVNRNSFPIVVSPRAFLSSNLIFIFLSIYLFLRMCVSFTSYCKHTLIKFLYK